MSVVPLSGPAYYALRIFSVDAGRVGIWPKTSVKLFFEHPSSLFGILLV